MMKRLILIVLLTMFLTTLAEEEPPKAKEKAKARQMEYISLINTLLQQTNVLSSVDGVLLAITTLLASFITKFKPVLIASALSYLLYVATAIFLPAPLAKMGLPTMEVEPKRMMGRSVDGESSSSLFETVMAETIKRSITISPVKSIITNVSINVITDTMGRIRVFSRMLAQQLSLFQRTMVRFSRSMSNECVAKFLCRVGQFTEVNFPMASSVLRTLADNYPGMDDYAVAVVRGTSSSNCSLIYPDCTM